MMWPALCDPCLRDGVPEPSRKYYSHSIGPRVLAIRGDRAAVVLADIPVGTPRTAYSLIRYLDDEWKSVLATTFRPQIIASARGLNGAYMFAIVEWPMRLPASREELIRKMTNAQRHADHRQRPDNAMYSPAHREAWSTHLRELWALARQRERDVITLPDDELFLANVRDE
jgi:hypothetical protein